MLTTLTRHCRRVGRFSLLLLMLLFPLSTSVATNTNTTTTTPAQEPSPQSPPRSGPAEDQFRNDINNKKIIIIIIVLSLCVIGAIILSLINVHDDFVELGNFYRGYLGRRLLMREGSLVSRAERAPTEDQCRLQVEKEKSMRTQNGGINIIKVKDTARAVIETSFVWDGLNSGAGGQDGLGPRAARRYIEDEEPEWRQLDYQMEVGQLPDSFCSFIRQYDWNMYRYDDLTSQEIHQRRNLLNQFRKWKKGKRKTFNIVVTERARREMADQEEEKNKKRNPPAK